MNIMKKLQLLLSATLVAALPSLGWAQEEITVHDPAFDEDEIFELPEGMTVSEDSLLGEWQNQNYLVPDTTCENPNYNPTYGPEVYRERLQRLPTIIEMTYNEVVQKFIDQYTNRLRRHVSAMLGASNFYIPIFEEALDYYGLPLELKYLPVIESALKPTAVSPAGAAGLWQFMLATGKRYNLEANSRVDERRDPIKSTWAAARFLRDLFKIYGDWHLVLAAYNCGPGNVNKAIHRADGARDYWEIYPYLPKETRGYVPAFIAANYVMNYYCDHNICPMRTKYPMATDTIMVTRNVDMRRVASICEVSEDVMKALNPQYKTNIIPGSWAPSTLRLPQEAVARFINQKDSIYSDQAAEMLRLANEQAIDQNSAAVQHPEHRPAATAKSPQMPSHHEAPARQVRHHKEQASTRHGSGGRNARNDRNARDQRHNSKAAKGKGKNAKAAEKAPASKAKGKTGKGKTDNTKAKGGKGKAAAEKAPAKKGGSSSKAASSKSKSAKSAAKPAAKKGKKR